MFDSQLLTADPEEHLRRAETLLARRDNSLLLYAALELRLAVERIVHNQLSMYTDHSLKSKRKNDPKRKKLIMKEVDPDCDYDYDIYYIDPEDGSKSLWGQYKNIPETKVKEIEGKLGNLLHMKLGLKLGVANDPWYVETRKFLETTANYLSERTRGSCYYFSYTGDKNFELVRKQTRA